jgi:protein-S-isoprenylcysteine O-methyltransferase Ste14
MLKWMIKVGNVLFKWRSFTPIPLIALVFVIFKPVNLNEKNIILNLGGLLISLLGEMIRIIAVGYSFTGTSGRETFLRADALNTTGIYAIVRNPLYIGNFLMFTGIVIVFSNAFAVLVFALFLILQYYFIILSEENFLQEKEPSAGRFFNPFYTLFPGQSWLPCT